MDRLGYDRYGAQGGDWGSMITAALGTAIPEALVGIHLTMPLALPPQADDQPLTPAEQAALAERKTFLKIGTGYAHEQSARRPSGTGWSTSPRSARGSSRSSGTGRTVRATRSTASDAIACSTT